MKHVKTYKYVHQDEDQRGNRRVYYRRRVGTPKIRLHAPIGSPEFEAELEAARVASDDCNRAASGPPAEQTFAWLYQQYRGSTAFRSLALRSQRVFCARIEWVLDQRLNPEIADYIFRDISIKVLKSRHFRALRDRKANAGVPEGANNILKASKKLLRWAVEYDFLDADPTATVRMIPTKSDGHPIWTADELMRFRDHYPVGSKERAVFEIALGTGLRRSDIVKLGPSHLSEGRLHIKTLKEGVPVTIPLSQPLKEALDALKSPGISTFIVTAYGHPFTDNGLGNWFRGRCDQAGIYDRSLHGLRKNCATHLAELGLSSHELMAVMGWKTLAEAERYTRAASRARMSISAMERLGRNKP